MSKQTKSQALKPISQVTAEHFYALDTSQLYYPIERKTLIDLEVRLAKYIVKSGNKDEVRRLYMYWVNINKWDNPVFLKLILAAALLRDYYEHHEGYPDNRKVKDAVANAVEFSYVMWIETDLVNRGMYRNIPPDQQAVLQRVAWDHFVNIGRANEWFRQKHWHTVIGLPQLMGNVELADVTSPVPVNWMNTSLLPPKISAPLPATTQVGQFLLPNAQPTVPG